MTDELILLFERIKFVRISRKKMLIYSLAAVVAQFYSSIPVDLNWKTTTFFKNSSLWLLKGSLSQCEATRALMKTNQSRKKNIREKHANKTNINT